MPRSSVRILAMSGLLVLAGCSGGGSSSPPPPPPPAANMAPTFTSAAQVSVAENSAGAIYTATATDSDGDTVSLSLSGGTDQTDFSFTPATGELAFAVSPDFEQPADANADNVYEAELTAQDGRGGQASLMVRVSVTDIDEGARIVRVATGFAQPLYIEAIPGTDRLAVVEKAGQIRVLNPANGVTDIVPFLDIRSEVSSDGERGLLGLAFSPEFASDRTFYVNLTNTSGDTEIRRYRMMTGSSTQADPATADIILEIGQPESNHNAGWIGFAPDGLLLVPMGDGGGGGDPDDLAQDTSTLLGKISRIDVTGDDFPGDDSRDYSIPADNPFASGGGRPEIWAIGLRNPFRSSIDPDTGDLYIGDVGQGAAEEISRVATTSASNTAVPLNFGWPIFEATLPFRGSTSAPLIDPVIEYEHADPSSPGRSVTGGYVYRGPVEALRDRYVFGDFISGKIWSIALADLVDGETRTPADLREETAQLVPDVGSIDNLSSFGEDADGNLYIVDLDGDVFVFAPDP